MFGNYIKLKRKENKLTLKNLSDLTDIDIIDLYQIERGKLKPLQNRTRLLKLSEVLDIDYPTLLILADAPYYQ